MGGAQADSGGPKRTRFGDPERRPGLYSRPFSSSYTGIQWKFQPRTFSPNSKVRNYLSRWSRSQVFRTRFEGVVRQLLQAWWEKFEVCFIDASLTAAKDGSPEVGLTRKGKGNQTPGIAEGQVLPLGRSLALAHRLETSMEQGTLAFVGPKVQQEQMVGDKGYDGDALDEALAALVAKIMAPHRSYHRPENATQDDRPRRYQRLLLACVLPRQALCVTLRQQANGWR